MSDLWLRAAGLDISAADVLLELKCGSHNDLLRALVVRKLAARTAEAEGLTVTADDLQAALDEFYAARDLFEAEQIAAWRQSLHLDEAMVREYVREQQMLASLRSHLASDDSVRRRFGANLTDYAQAEVDVFQFDREGAAKEFMLAVREREIEPAGGERRRVSGRSAPEDIAAALFSSGDGALVGPVERDDEGGYEVYRLLHRTDPRLDEDLRESIRDEIFEEAMAAALSRDPVAFLV